MIHFVDFHHAQEAGLTVPKSTDTMDLIHWHQHCYNHHVSEYIYYCELCCNDCRARWKTYRNAKPHSHADYHTQAPASTATPLDRQLVLFHNEPRLHQKGSTKQ